MIKRWCDDMGKWLIAVVIISVLVALFPLIVNLMESLPTIMGTVGTTTTPAAETGYLVVVKPSVSSSGTDTLIVEPGEVIVTPGTVFNVTIKVLFKHAQPCPYSDWRVEYELFGGVKVLKDTEGELVDAKTYVRTLTVAAECDGIITVIFHYGSECPYGDMESVNVTVWVSNETALRQQETTSVKTVTTETYTTTSEEEVTETISGKVTNVDVDRAIIYVDETPIYVKGDWVTENGTIYDAATVVASIKVGEEVTIQATLTGSGRLHAIIIETPETTFSKS